MDRNIKNWDDLVTASSGVFISTPSAIPPIQKNLFQLSEEARNAVRSQSSAESRDSRAAAFVFVFCFFVCGFPSPSLFSGA